MKTLIACKHPGLGINGFGGCHARLPLDDGICPGAQIAIWLNDLGPDDEVYMKIGGNPVTNGEVRQNWLRSNGHIIAVDPELAAVSERLQRAKREVRLLTREHRRLQKIRNEEYLHQTAPVDPRD